MGFHNPSELGSELSTAGQLAQSARQKASDALPASFFPVPIPPDMTVGPSGGAPGTLLIQYTVSRCNASDHALVLGNFSSFQTATSVNCSIGSTGSYTFAPPSGDVWFLIAGVEGAAFSSLGLGTAGERQVSGVPAACPSIAAQNTTAICP